MADSFTLPLRPIIEKRDQKDSLPAEIAQINSQWGSFRDVTEDSLRAEIAAEKDKDAEVSHKEDAQKPSADVDTTERLEQLYKRRAEITQFALQAHMETMFALDFVSLILSKHAPRQAETSMSPFLKQAVPLGSLNAEVVNPRPKSESIERDIKTVSRGWRIQSFNAAADKLLKSATRLEDEVASETRYWSEVLTVKDKGWKVCRLPRERQALGVQYGFLEATPIFRDRGLASLRRADDGSLILDQGLLQSKTRTVRVRVREGGRITGRSKPPKPTSNYHIESVEGRILQARDNIFEEELFHELVREARVMASQGVTTRQNLIQLPVSDEQNILLDLVDVDAQDSPPDDAEPASDRDNVLAEGLAHSVHILLSYAHRQNLRRRTQIPPPLTPKKKYVPEYQLLRPAMAYLQHHSHVIWLQSFLRDIYDVVKSSGLNCGYTAAPFSSVKVSRTDSSTPRVEAIVEQFLHPLESTFSSTLVARNSSFKVKIRTNLSGPPFGTNYDFSISMPNFPDVKPPARVGLKDDAAAIVTHLILLGVVSAISSYRPKNETTQDSEKQASLTWESTYPHHGELLTFSPKMRLNKKMKVTLSRHEMTVTTHYVRGIIEKAGFGDEGPDKDSQSRTWTGVPRDSTVSQIRQPSLMDFVAEASRD